MLSWRGFTCLGETETERATILSWREAYRDSRVLDKGRVRISCIGEAERDRQLGDITTSLLETELTSCWSHNESSFWRQRESSLVQGEKLLLEALRIRCWRHAESSAGDAENLLLDLRYSLVGRENHPLETDIVS